MSYRKLQGTAASLRLLVLLAGFEPPRPLAVCTFDSHTCGWVNDANNWQHKWTLNAASLCLQMVSAGSGQSADDSGASAWLPQSALRKKTKPSKTPTTARLWSPPIPGDLNLQCLQFAYRIFADPKPASLSLLQRQEG